MERLTKVTLSQHIPKKIRLAVIPSDPIEAYKQKGTSSWLEGYYNPGKFADEVYALSPFEEKEYLEFGMRVIPTQPDQLADRIKSLNIDLVRAYGGYSACDMASNNKVTGVPVIVSVHDTNPDLLYDSIKSADAVFCMSEAVKQLVLTKYENGNHVWILPNRVNFEVMKPYQRNDLNDLKGLYPYKYKILHVGRKSNQKNLDTLLYALERLGDNYCLIAIGNSYDDTCQKLAEKINIAKRCFFIESVPNEQLPRYYSFADCMCTPSRWEGFGLVFIEALACEAVVVTSNIAPMSEYIKHAENGILVDDYENPEALAKSIQMSCMDSRLRQIVKNNARESVRCFEKRTVDALEVSYYEKVLAMNMKGLFKNSWFTRVKKLIGA